MRSAAAAAASRPLMPVCFRQRRRLRHREQMRGAVAAAAGHFGAGHTPPPPPSLNSQPSTLPPPSLKLLPNPNSAFPQAQSVGAAFRVMRDAKATVSSAAAGSAPPFIPQRRTQNTSLNPQQILYMPKSQSLRHPFPASART